MRLRHRELPARLMRVVPPAVAVAFRRVVVVVRVRVRVRMA